MAKKVKNSPKNNGSLPDVYLVCEGAADEALLALLVQKILQQNRSGISVVIVSAHGRLQIPRIVRALDDQAGGKSRVGIVVDSDGQIEATRTFLARSLNLDNYFVAIAYPSIESWFGDESKSLANPEQMRHIIDELNLDELVGKYPEIAVLRENLTRKSTNFSPTRLKCVGYPVHSHS